MDLDLCPQVINSMNNESLYYNLNAKIVHKGPSIDNGHYYCYVKDAKDNWVLMDDSEARFASIQTVVLNEKTYILLYSRAKAHNQTSHLTIRKLSVQNKSNSNCFTYHK